MGTFHDTNDPLHGVTVVADTGARIYIGRCHERDEQRVVLIDVDQHEDGQDGVSNQAFLEQAARLGVWKKHDRLILPAQDIRSLTPLSEHYRTKGSPPVEPVGATTRDGTSRVTEATDGFTTASPAPTTGGEAPTTPVTLTDDAREQVRRLLADEADTQQGLRLGIQGGGCSGLSYKVEFDGQRDNDIVLTEDGFDVYLDHKSMIYLRGVTLDYEKGLGGRGFQFHNPNASNTCGCGESFAV